MAAGCAHSEPQPLWTDEALPTPPDSQLAPTIQSVESTTVRLQWSQSAKPNEKIIYYEVIHRCLEREDWGDGTTQVDENVVFTESNIVRDSWLCTE